MDQNTKDIIDSLNFIKENMATKSELEALSEKIDDVHIELRGNSRASTNVSTSKSSSARRNGCQSA